MDDTIILVISTVQNLFYAFVHSVFFLVLKIFLMIYTTVLIVDVILLMYLGDVRKQLRAMKMGAANVKISKKPDQLKWRSIMERLETDDEKQYRAAILEADKFVYDSLAVQGYGGGNFAERIAQVPPGSFESLDVVRDVHALSKKIVFDDKVRITKEQAQNALTVYEQFLKDLDIL